MINSQDERDLMNQSDGWLGALSSMFDSESAFITADENTEQFPLLMKKNSEMPESLLPITFRY